MTNRASNDASHLPVLLNEVVTGLAIVPGETLVDGTFGAGGYTRALLGEGAGRVIGFDRDPNAIANGPSLVPDERLTLIEERFSQMDRVLAERGLLPVDGIALDIGVSSMSRAGLLPCLAQAATAITASGPRWGQWRRGSPTW